MAPISEMDAGDPDFKPLTAEEAQRLRAANPALSPWWVVAAQVAAGLVVAVVALLWARDWSVAGSALYGALAIALPAALFVRALHRPAVSTQVAMLRFAVWEMVKLGLSVLMLGLAWWLVEGLNGLALLAGVVAALKMYWLALVAQPKLLKRN